MTVSMSAAEATATDPQVRLLLEIAYESLENGTPDPSISVYDVLIIP